MVTESHMHCAVRLTRGARGVAAGAVGTLVLIAGDSACVEFPFYVDECPYITVPADSVEPVEESAPHAA